MTSCLGLRQLARACLEQGHPLTRAAVLPDARASRMQQLVSRPAAIQRLKSRPVRRWMTFRALASRRDCETSGQTWILSTLGQKQDDALWSCTLQRGLDPRLSRRVSASQLTLSWPRESPLRVLCHPLPRPADCHTPACQVRCMPCPYTLGGGERKVTAAVAHTRRRWSHRSFPVPFHASGLACRTATGVWSDLGWPLSVSEPCPRALASVRCIRFAARAAFTCRFGVTCDMLISRHRPQPRRLVRHVDCSSSTTK